MSVQKQMVLAGRGWTILPGAGVARDVQEGRLSGAPLSTPSLSRSVVVALQRTNRISRAVQAVNLDLLSVSRDLVVSGTGLPPRCWTPTIRDPAHTDTACLAGSRRGAGRERTNWAARPMIFSGPVASLDPRAAEDCDDVRNLGD